MSLTASQINSIYAALFGPTNLPAAAQLATWQAIDAVQGDNAVILDIVNSPASQQSDYAIVQLIQFVQGTVPTAAQLQGWVAYLEAGNALSSVVNAFAGSTNFQDNFNNGNAVANVNAPVNSTIAANIIFQALGTIPATSQIQAWVNTGISIAQMVTQFALGDQYSARTSSFIENYLYSIAAHAAGLPGAVAPTGALFEIPANLTISDSTGGTGLVTEGNSVTYTVTGIGIANGTTANYAFTGATGQLNGPNTGILTFENDVATLTVSTHANVLGGPSQALALTVSGSGLVTGTDTVSVVEAQQTISGNASVNEGSGEHLTVSTTGVPGLSVAGLTENYTVSGTGTSQVTPTAGTLTLDSNGQATIDVPTKASVFNTTTPTSFTATLLNNASPQTSITVTVNETAIMSAADNAGGTTTQTILGTAIAETTTGGQITDGNAVTFTVSVTGVNGAAVAGTTEAWTVTGTAAGDVAGPTSGTLTLDANGQATVTIDTAYSGAFGSGDLTFALTGVPVTDTVAVVAPAIVDFTTKVGETLTGGPADTTFVGVVDDKVAGNETYNPTDSAVGTAGFNNTLELFINNESGAGTIVLDASNVQTLDLTDDNAESTVTNFDASLMAQLTQVNFVSNMQDEDDIVNLQNVVGVGIINNDLSGSFSVELTVTNAAAAAYTAAGGGAVSLNLDNAGPLALEYRDTAGNDFITAFAITNAGDNGLALWGASAAQSITVAGTGSLWMTFDGTVSSTHFTDHDLFQLTSVDARGLGGAYTDNYQFGFDPDIWQNFTFLGAQGSTFVSLLDDITGNTISVTTYGGNDSIAIDTVNGSSGPGNGETVTVNSGGGNSGATNSGSGNGGDSITLTGENTGKHEGAINQTLSVTSGDGNNTLSITSADNADVQVTQGNGNNGVTVDLWNGQMTSPAHQSAGTVVVQIGNGANTVTVDTAENGNSGDDGSNVTVEANPADGSDNGDDTVSVTAGYDSTTNVTLGSGTNDKVTIKTAGSDNDPRPDFAIANVTVGTGSNINIGYTDTNASTTGYDEVVILAGNSVSGGDSGAGGTIAATIGWSDNSGPTADGYAKASVGDGSYSFNLTADGSDSLLSVAALNGDNNITETLSGNNDTGDVNVGSGNNTILVQDIVTSGDVVNVTAGSGNDNITVAMGSDSGAKVTITASSSAGHADTISVGLLANSGSSVDVNLSGSSGNNSVSLSGFSGAANSNTATVSGGSGNDWVSVDSTTLQSNLNLNGGGGYNTLALPGNVTALDNIPPSPVQVTATIQNFQALEFTSQLTQNVDVLDLGPNNLINQVIFDGGFSGTPLQLWGLFTGVTVDGMAVIPDPELDFLWANSKSQTLDVYVGNASPSPNDLMNILLDSQNQGETTHQFGTVNIDPPSSSNTIQTVALESTAASGEADNGGPHPVVTNNIVLLDTGLVTLNVLGLGTGDPDATAVSMVQGLPFHNAIADADVYLNLTGSGIDPATVNAASTPFYAGIQDTDGALGGTVTTNFNAPDTTLDNLVFGNATGDKASLGNFGNTVVMGNGAGDSLTMSAVSNVYGSANGGNDVAVGDGQSDHITLGNNDSGDGNVVIVGDYPNHVVGSFPAVGNSAAPSSTDTNGDVITLGTGGNVSGNQVLIFGDNTTPGASGSIATDTVTFNSGSGSLGGNTVTLNAVTASTVNLGDHTTADTIAFNHYYDSDFSLPDVINGFVGGADALQFNHNIFAADAQPTHFALDVVSGAVGVFAALASEATWNTSGGASLIFDNTTGDLYVDVNSDGKLDFTHDMQINLVGVSTLTSAEIHIS